MRRLYSKLLPWLIRAIPAIAIVGSWVIYADNPADLSKPTMFAGTLFGLWVATLTAYVTSRSTQHQILVTTQRHFFSDETMPALSQLGPIYSEELRKLVTGGWQLKDNVGFRYLQEFERSGELHKSRRELSGLYESLCSLVEQGVVSHDLAVSVFANLEERATWLTVVEELLALKISAGRFTNRNRDLFVDSWNKSRCWLWPKYRNIEVGKPNMRAFSRMRLILDATEPSVCDYDDRTFRVNPNELLVSDPQNPDAPLRIKDITPAS